MLKGCILARVMVNCGPKGDCTIFTLPPPSGSSKLRMSLILSILFLPEKTISFFINSPSSLELENFLSVLMKPPLVLCKNMGLSPSMTMSSTSWSFRKPEITSNVMKSRAKCSAEAASTRKPTFLIRPLSSGLAPSSKNTSQTSSFLSA